ncbi:small proline-rich protein 2G [Mus musculus]|nr:small proline-rich protein 2G [Mus musculus]
MSFQEQQCKQPCQPPPVMPTTKVPRALSSAKVP